MKRLLPYVLLFMEVALFFRHVLFIGGYVIPWDLRYDHYPIAVAVAESFERGELPLWDPYTYCGRPLYANIQAQVFYPPMIATALLSNLSGGDRLLYFLEWQLALHVFLGGCFTYLLLRRLKTSPEAALAGATVYQLGGFFASQAQHLGAIDAAGWLPFTWLCILHLSEKPTVRWTALLASGFAMTILAGLPAMTAVVFTAGGLLAVALAGFGFASWRLLYSVVGAALTSLALSAIQLAPTIELTWRSVAQYRDDWLGSGGGLPLESLVSLVIPNYYGIFDLMNYSLPYDPTFLYLYGSYAGLALSIAAAIRPRRRETALMAVVTFLCALWMLGDSTPIGAMLFAVLPGYIQIGVHPEFALAAFGLSFAVLAGLAVDQFIARPLFARLLVVAIAADLILVSSGHLMNAFPTDREPGVGTDRFDGNRELLASLRDLVGESTPPSRIDTVSDSLNWAMTAPVTKVPTANGNDPFSPARVIQARLAFVDSGQRWGRYYEVDDLSSPVLDLMNVRFLLSRQPLDSDVVEEAGFLPPVDLPYRKVYENTDVLPRFYLVSRVRWVGDLSEAAARLRSADFDPRVEAVVEGDGAPLSGDGPAGAVTVTEYSPLRVSLEIDASRTAFLATSETYYSGWKAFVDDQPAELLYTNVAFRGLAIPAGRHEVVMEFAPQILWRAAAVSSAAWLLWGIAISKKRHDL